MGYLSLILVSLITQNTLLSVLASYGERVYMLWWFISSLVLEEPLHAHAQRVASL